MMTRSTRLNDRRGVSLLLCLFVIGITSVLIVGILDTIMIRQSAIRNSADYERALYLAGAGTHHVLAEIEQNPGWRGSIGPIEFPRRSGNFYAASAVDGVAGRVVVSAQGTAAGVARNVQVTVEP